MSTILLAGSDTSESLRGFARSIGQIVLQRHAATGALLVAAVCSFSPRLACALLIGALTGNVIAYIVEDAGSPAMREDLYGFNGALAALAAFGFIRDDSQAGAVAIVSAMLATGLSFRLGRALEHWPLPAYSSPAVLVTWCWLPLFADAPSGAAAAATVSTAAPASWASAIVAGFSPIVFTTGFVAGALILVGLVAAQPARPVSAAWALTGSTLGVALHALAGTPAAVVLSGGCGFNATLTALATSKFGVKGVLGGGVVCVLVERVAAALGIPALTAPFVLASWAVQAFVQRLETPANNGDSHVVHPPA
jgi:urea transporter